MRLSINTLLTILAIALVGAPTVAAAQQRTRSVIAEPGERNPNAITRPTTQGDREWRRGRATPELRMPRNAPAARRAAPAPRYDARGRRRNVPGRPDTLDAIGRANRFEAQRPRIVPSAPTVRTDAARRINQFPPPSRR